MHLLPEPGNQGSVIRELIPFLKALKHPLAHYPHPKWLSRHTPQSSLHAPFSGFVCFFQARFAFQPFNEGSAAREECRCMLSSFQPKDNPRWVPRAWNRAGRRLVPSGDTPGHLTGCRGLPREGQWSSLELVLELKPGWAGCLFWDGNGKWG